MRIQFEWKERLPIQVAGPHVAQVSRKWVAISVACWMVVVLYIAQANLPRNVITLPGQNAAAPMIGTLVPQGWGFFTKSPRDIEFQPYLFRDGRWGEGSLGPQGEPRYAFGFDRRSRSQGIEIALLLAEASRVKWTKCGGGTVTRCLDAGGPVSGVRNRTPQPTLCGRVAVVQQEPVPFAWRDLLPTSQTPASATFLEVTC